MNQLQGMLRRQGQLNYSVQYPGVIKAWHRHAKQTDFWICLSGHLKVGVHRDEDQASWSLVFGERRLGVLVIPPGRPTSAEELARLSYQLANRHLWGTWHVTDAGDCTWFDFASRIRDLISDCRVEPCDTRSLNRPAKRPERSVLDLSRTSRVLGTPSPWWENVADVVARIECEQPATANSRIPA